MNIYPIYHLDDDGYIGTAVGVRHDHVTLAQVIPIEGDCALDGLGAEGHGLLAPGDGHHSFQLQIALVWCDGDHIGLGIVGELIVADGDEIVLAVAEVIAALGIVPVVVDGVVIGSLLVVVSLFVLLPEVSGVVTLLVTTYLTLSYLPSES